MRQGNRKLSITNKIAKKKKKQRESHITHLIAQQSFKGNRYIFKKATAESKVILLPPENGSTLEEKIMIPNASKCFPFE